MVEPEGQSGDAGDERGDAEGILYQRPSSFEDLMIERRIVCAPVSEGKRQRKWGREVAEADRACPVAGGNI